MTVEMVVTFHYMDGEEQTIKARPEDMEKYMNRIGRSEVCFNHEKGVGLWINIDKVRWFEVERVDEQGRRVVVSNDGLHERDGKNSSGAVGAEAQGDE